MQITDKLPYESESVSGLLLTRQWFDRVHPTGFGRVKQLELVFWVQTDLGPARVSVTGQRPVFFLKSTEAERANTLLVNILGHSASHPSFVPSWEIKSLTLRDFENEQVVAVYFREQRSLIKARNALMSAGLDPLEADIQPYDRYLMERFISGDLKIQGNWSRERGYLSVDNAQLQADSYEPEFTVVSLDIETSMDAGELYCIGVTTSRLNKERSEGTLISRENRVFMISDEPVTTDQAIDVLICADETSLMTEFVQWFVDLDPGIVIGWNVINFDLRVLQEKADELAIPLRLGRGKSLLDWRQSRGDDDHYTLVVPGRLVLCGIDTLKSATYQFESFALDDVARELLNRGKLSDDVDHRSEQITWQFHEDKAALALYNIEDCRLVEDIFSETQLIEFALVRTRITGLAMDRFGGSVAAFDQRYLPRLHRKGYVAPSLVENPVGVGSPGGFVMESVPGLYRDVLVLDFKSLYPSIIRTFQIDPLARVAGNWIEEADHGHTREPVWDQQESDGVDRKVSVPGYNDAVFSREHALLPEIIGELWSARDKAKRERNSALSQSIKIIMNSFYGVLGTPGCRFFDYRLPSSITLRGHWVLTQTEKWLKDRGLEVIYGDTDSVFVWLKDTKVIGSEGDIGTFGKQLADELNEWWKQRLETEYLLQSFLEIEFETHYKRFVMPRVRNSDVGSKKRYAGLLANDGRLPTDEQIEDKLVFKGLEAVRSDWTPLARKFQRELYLRVFADRSYDQFIIDLVEDVRAGRHDNDLVYRKRIRRPLDEYVKNVPPHVVAAKKADEWYAARGNPPRYRRGGWIRYVFTLNGPEPIEVLVSRPDYDRYIERQIKPVADGLLQLMGRDFDEIADQQLGLFSEIKSR